MRTLPFLTLLASLITAGCATAQPTNALVLRGATVVGHGPASVTIGGDTITAVGSAAPGAVEHDLAGRFLVPAFIDAHVHLAYTPQAEELAQGGIAGAVDWAAPITAVGERVIHTAWAGPILTAVQGYPTQGWGRDGYGMEVSGVAEGRKAVAAVQQAGATIVKIAVGAGGPELSDEILTAICDEAHSRDMLVGAHALNDASALRAASVGADILVHAPSGTLSDATIQAWAPKSVIPTISAFGGVTSTQQLAQAGATVLYGTDFGNTRALGISSSEVAGMEQAGLSGASILAAGTSVPAERFGFTTLGSIEVGREASLLVLDRDPLTEPSALSEPVAVIWRGQVVRGSLAPAP